MVDSSAFIQRANINADARKALHKDLHQRRRILEPLDLGNEEDKE